MKLWQADPHQYGPGKMHIIDPDAPEKTMCGRLTSAVPGKPKTTGTPTCRICLDAGLKREEARARMAEWEQKRYQDERQREEQNEIWWQRYNVYLQSPEWRKRRRLVFKRCGGFCEGCGLHPATQVHHLTYEHMGNEFLWELRGICSVCHMRIHDEAL